MMKKALWASTAFLVLAGWPTADATGAPERKNAFRIGAFLSESTGSGTRTSTGTVVDVGQGRGLRFSWERRFGARTGLMVNAAFFRQDATFDRVCCGSFAVDNDIESGSAGFLVAFHPAPGRKVDFYAGPGVEFVFHGTADGIPGTTEAANQPSLQVVAGIDILPGRRGADGRVGLNLELRYSLQEIEFERSFDPVSVSVDPLSLTVGVIIRK